MRKSYGTRPSASTTSFAAGSIAVDLGQNDINIRLPPQHRPNRLRDIRGRQHRRGDLIEQGLEEMVVAPIDDRYAHGRVGKRLRRLQPGESTADDHDVGKGGIVRMLLRSLAAEPGQSHDVSLSLRTGESSVAEMPRAGENHGYAGAVGGGNNLVVAHGAARLDDGDHARGARCFQPIREREEGIAGQHRARGPLTGLAHRDAHALHAVGLTAADPGQRSVTGQDDGV